MLRLLASLLFLLSTPARAELFWQYSTDGMISGNPVVHKGRVYVTAGKGQKIFATPASKHNLAELQNPDRGLDYLYSSVGGYTHKNAASDVQRMLSKLDILLSLTLDDDTLCAGSANGTSRPSCTPAIMPRLFAGG